MARTSGKEEGAISLVMTSSPLHRLILLLLLLLLIHPFTTTAQTYRNLTSGSSLSPLGSSSSWLSPSGDFAFGFRPLETNNTLFLLAVWFDKTVNKTLVWYANGDSPVQAGSEVELTADGQLSLKDPTGREVWNARVRNASYAAILDTGNLVLAGSDGTPRWQSFRLPTDTILPTQSLELGSSLWARLTDTDYSNGRFRIDMQGNGNLEFHPVALPAANVYEPYWNSNTSGNGLRLIFNQMGSIYIALKDGSQLNFTSGRTESTGDYYQRGTLDPDGVFRHYVYPKPANGGEPGWTAVDFLPYDICQAMNLSIGSGACGFNSYCKSTGSVNQRVDCECPLQYSFLDPSRKYEGCKPDFAAQSCKDDASAAFELKEMINVDWPIHAYEEYMSIDENECRNQCMSDCFCALAIHSEGNCWKKNLPLANGKTNALVQRVALIKVPKVNNSQPQLPASTGEHKSRRRGWVLLGSSFLAISVFLNLLLIAIYYRNKRMRKLQPELSAPGLNLRCFTYTQLEVATKGFSEEVGRGSSGRVYKGYLRSEFQTWVAIKKLDKLLQETEKEFTNEIRSIGQTHHKNLVQLLGFCKEGTERLLVYEFMTNGSLTSFLFGEVRPDWSQRKEIALGIARGLLYLHEECSSQIIHCDIKPHNILLDDNFVARISDFGLAKLLRVDQTRTNTGIRGTRGYVAPEWFKNSAITAMVDVYSYGVMLLEIICCRKNVEPEVGNEEVILTFRAYDCYRDGRVGELVEGDEEAMADIGWVEMFVAVAMWCIQEKPSLRPSMKRVTQMIDGSVAVPVPPDPSP